MIDDIRPPDRQRPQPKRIEPLEKPAVTPLHELAAEADPSFKTPEEVAESETGQESEPTVIHHQEQKQAWYRRLVPRTKRQKIIAGVMAVVVAFGLGAGWTLTHHKRTVVAVTPPPAAPKPAPIIYSKLSGLPVASEAVNQRPVTGVMVENSLDARPQSGLSQAGVVFEAVAEGGVTRFLALYQDQAPSNVGPIRSARPYYIEWDMGFDAAYAHVGGSVDGLHDITAWGTKDMNQFYNAAYYHRITSRYAPHNVYTAISTLNKLEAAKHFTTSNYTGFDRKADDPYQPPAKPSDGSKPLTNEPVRTAAHSIDFQLSGYYYDPHYSYSAATNSYNRSEAGEPQMDANTKKQLSPKVVIAIVVPLARGKLDTSGAYYSNYNVIGSGTAYVFQDGTLQKATWHKASRTDNISFTDASGQPFKLDRGQTWISAVTGTGKIHYK